MSVGRIEAARERCIGAGNCVDIDPAHFAQDDADGTVLVIDGDATESDIANVGRAVDACPVAALMLHRT
jgi:ferredoxin